MPFTIVRDSSPGFTRYDVAGPPSVKNYFDLIEETARETLASHEKLVLVDLRGVTGRLSFTDQFFIGELVGEKLAHIRKVAVVVPDDPDTYNSPKVAQRKGVNMQTFRSEEEAVAWLTEERRQSRGGG